MVHARSSLVRLLARCAVFVVLVTRSVADKDNIVKLTKFNFNSNVKTGAWFVKFYAPWCTHCQRLAPIWEKLADEQVARDWPLKIAEVDCTTSKEVCEKVQVKAFPLLMLIQNGEMVDKYKGEASAAQFEEWLSNKGLLQAGAGGSSSASVTSSEKVDVTGGGGSSKTSIKVFYKTMISTMLNKMLAEFPTKSQILNLYFYGLCVILVLVLVITRLFKYVEDEETCAEAETDKSD